ncbi:hypothetical protein ACMFWY_22340 [Roseiconus sp. JC912]|uniref:hypothetical protein n=1 Tax=Roseiconus sp. JC912 TaxID=3396307 RepID=UPI003A4C5F4D
MDDDELPVIESQCCRNCDHWLKSRGTADIGVCMLYAEDFWGCEGDDCSSYEARGTQFDNAMTKAHEGRN